MEFGVQGSSYIRRHVSGTGLITVQRTFCLKGTVFIFFSYIKFFKHQIDPSVPEAALLLRYRLNKTITHVSGYYEEQMKLAAGLGQVLFLLWFVLCHMGEV